MNFFLIRYLVAKICGWKLVWLRDFDNEIVLRCARPTPFGLVAYRMGYANPSCLLNPDGSVSGKSKDYYVKNWAYHKLFKD